MKDRSDKKAKESFVLHLAKSGYDNIQIVKEPSDIVAYKNGIKYYFEIKKTSAEKEYFGAATLTEWRSAYANPHNYFFVICQERNDFFSFTIYTPEEFEKFSTIPPFKIFFNITLNGTDKVLTIRKNKSAIQLTKDTLTKMDALFTTLKK